ncbi:MAG: hypothetical protein QOD92_4201 [Acidimicrobiaceae bacterium]|jgi:phosphatidylethanolamine/phosphatidyl-N-methylethanolamine N-methyltransferase
MSFPYHDRNWNEAAEFLDNHLHEGDRVLAPDRFWWRLVCPVERWVASNLSTDRTYDWVITHKGELDQFSRGFLEHVALTMRAVFANPVFVIWTSRRIGNTVDPGSSHLISFHEIVAGLPAAPVRLNSYEQDRVFDDRPRLARFADMTHAELRATENQFFRDGGYRYVTARDRGYYDDIHRHLAQALSRWTGGRILDLGCGGLPMVRVPSHTLVVRVDFADEGVRLAVVADRHESGCRYATVDGHHLAFPDACFDGVAFVDSVEHVRDATTVLREVARVLRPGGELLVTHANRNSMNQVITRKLGYPEFLTNHQHIREFTPAEFAEVLAGVGLDVIDTAGVGMLPYWGIPGIDEVVRELTDDDAEVVEMMRVIGERAGAEYAYVSVHVARKAG